MSESPLAGSIPSQISAAERPNLVYVLTTDCRDVYADMALVSMLSVGLSNPGITTMLLVDTISMVALQKYRHKLLQISDSIVTVDTPSGSAVFRSRWLKTQVGQFIQGKVICLDVDTIVRSSIDWLDQFHSDFGAVADAPMLVAKQDTSKLLMSEKMGWNPQGTYYNSGFFYFVSSPAVTRFFETWHLLWQDSKDTINHQDQPSFNAAITRADFKEQELAESFNLQITQSWKNCQQSKVWHFWESSRMGGDILEELTHQSAYLSLDQLRGKVQHAVTKRTPAGYANHLARVMDLLSIEPELQRRLLIQKSRLSRTQFLQWSLGKLVGR